MAHPFQMKEVQGGKSSASARRAGFPVPNESGQDITNKHLTVLAVNNETALLSMLARVILRAGHMCITARNGNDALVRYGTNRPDVVVSCFSMPDMDAPELVGRLKRADPRVKVIIVSPQIRDNESRACLAAGANAVLPDKVKAEELLATLAKVGDL